MTNKILPWLRPTAVRHALIVTTAALLLPGCGAPTQPTPNTPVDLAYHPLPPRPPTSLLDAVVEITEFRVYRIGRGADYTASLRIAETGGRSGVVVSSVAITPLDREPELPIPWTTSGFLPAGTTISLLSSATDVYGDPFFSFSPGGVITRARVVVSFADDAGRTGSVTAIGVVS